ncbi:MAG: tRNA pseudouridine(55) synthase TruB [Nevskia sp.]|nr:tRNA pseudouridine(55) synthase TruB [Nevskia sp.]
MPPTKVSRRSIDGILLLDKPLGLSSNAALQIVKRLYRAEKAGHTGSLDPLATGLLPICLGQATKVSAYLLDSDKRYRARARLGARTSTGDAEGEVVATSDPAGVSRRDLEAVLPRFLGGIEQVPPMYSALKRDGQPLYALARAGIEVERAARRVQIRELRLLRFDGDSFEFEVACSKGTYIRTLAEDLAAAAGQQAHLVELRRTGLAPFDAAAMVALERLQAESDEAARDALLLAPAAALQGWPEVEVDEALALQLGHGRQVRAGTAPAGLAAVYGRDRRLLGIVESDGAGSLAPRRWLGGGAAA